MIRAVCFLGRNQRFLNGSATHIAGTKVHQNVFLGSHDIHVSSSISNSKVTDIPLPQNVEDINGIETARFSPQRARDITGDVIGALNSSSQYVEQEENCKDNSIESYDCSGTVSLNSAMQTNVPDPYTSKGKAPTHLNMPGGVWGRSDKYVAEDQHNSHYRNVREESGVNNLKENKGIYSILNASWNVGHQHHLRHYSSNANTPDKKEQIGVEDNKVSKLKKAVKDYGSTVIVFHVGISLISLGGFYMAVTSGLDLSRLIPSDMPADVATEVGSFIVAYAVHKAFAPVRISITLFCTPFIVRYLRRVGILSSPKK